MKRILSILLALVMVIGMLPMSILTASAAESSVTMSIFANKGTLSGTTISWTSEGVTFQNSKASSSTAIRTSDSDHYRLYVGSSVTITAPGNITKIVMVSTETKYAIAPTGADGSVGTVDSTTITIVPAEASTSYTIPKISTQTRVKTLTVTYVDASAVECEHTNTEAIEAKDPTCIVPGNTAGVKCADCGVIISGNEAIPATGHTEDEGVVTAPTCLKDGYTLYTCSVCGNERRDYIDATGHSYVDGVCSSCGLELPADMAGKYYIAAKRKDGNYFYMTANKDGDNDRYIAVDSTLPELPENITDILSDRLFELVSVDGGYVIKTGEQYLGWSTSNKGNTCLLVDLSDAVVATVEYSTFEGAYYIHFAASDAERYLSLNATTGNDYFIWYKEGQAKDLYLVPVSETAEVCKHENTTETTEDATCGENGSVTVVCDDCGITVSVETIEAIGHNYIDGVCDNCGEAEVVVPSEATITFDDKSKRTEYTTSIQVWVENGVTVTNNKASSTSNVGDYVQPARFYKSSTVTVAYPGLTKIVFNCYSAQYATDLGKSITGATVTVDGKVVTVELTSAVDSFTTGGMSAQVRVDSLTVYTSKVCNHVWGDAVQTADPNCAEEGENTITCTLCGEERHESIPALGHVIDNGVCSVCSGNIYPLATTLNDNDNVIIYNPANKVAMGKTVNSYNKMNSVACAASNGIAVQDDMAIMQVKYVEGSETEFYLMLDGKYLTTDSDGGSLFLADEADDYSTWNMKVTNEAEGLVYINSCKSVNGTKQQSLEYYGGSFTTYGGSDDAFKMKLYVVAGEAEPVAKIGETEYYSFEEAYAAAEEAQYIKLLADVEFNTELSKNLYIDLNGNTIEGEIVKGEFAVYGIDSVTTDYQTVGGYLGLTVDGGLVVAQTQDGYAMYEGDNGWTFNAYKLAITHVSLDANKDALGYKAELKGNARVQAAVTGYGFTMGVNKKAQTVTASGPIDDGVFTLRLYKIMATNGGEKEINATAFVIFNGDDKNAVTTGQYTTTMKKTILDGNDMFEDLSDAQKAAVQKLYSEHESVIAKWLEGKINNFAPVSNVVPSAPEGTEQ